MKNNLNCTVIFLSYNTRKVTDTCLTKLDKAIIYAQSKLKNKIDVIVVDNASKDKSAQMIKKKHPKVKLIAMNKNIGYSAGNNLAMSKSKTPLILLMNSDTYIYKDSLEKIISKMAMDNKYDVLVSRYAAKKTIHENHGGFLPTPNKAILWSLGIESLPIIKKYINKIYSLNRDEYYKEGFIEWYSPCFMLLKRKVFERTGGYDEKLWFHMVDVEWCKRIKDFGFRMYYTPDIFVQHIGGASSVGMDYILLRDNFKGVMYFFKKHYPKKVELVKAVLKTGLYTRSMFFMLIGNFRQANAYFKTGNSI